MWQAFAEWSAGSFRKQTTQTANKRRLLAWRNWVFFGAHKQKKERKQHTNREDKFDHFKVLLAPNDNIKIKAGLGDHSCFTPTIGIQARVTLLNVLVERDERKLTTRSVILAAFRLLQQLGHVENIKGGQPYRFRFGRSFLVWKQRHQLP